MALNPKKLTQNFDIQSFEDNPLNNPAFLAVKQKVYKEEQMEWKKNEDIALHFLHKYWIVFQKNIPIARACLYVNEDLEWEGQNIATIGNFECTNEFEIAHLLLYEIESYALSEGFSAVIGPMNGSTFNQYRFPATPIDRPFFSEEYYPLYYIEFWKKCGYNSISKYLSCVAELASADPEMFMSAETFANKGMLSFRSIKLNDFANELGRIHTLVTKCFVNNKFYTPITLEDFLAQYLPYKEYVDERFFLLAEHSGSIVALIYCIPDYYAQDKKRLVIKTILVDSSVRSLGVMKSLGQIIYTKAKDEGYHSIIHAYMHQLNGSLSLSEKFGGRQIRLYELLGKNLKNE